MKIKGGRTRHRGNLKRWPLHTVPPAEPSSPWSVPPLFLRVQGSGGKMFPCVVVLLALGHAMIFTSASSLKLAPWLSSRYSATSMLVAWFRFESIVLLLVVHAKTRSGFFFCQMWSVAGFKDKQLKGSCLGRKKGSRDVWKKGCSLDGCLAGRKMQVKLQNRSIISETRDNWMRELEACCAASTSYV